MSHPHYSRIALLALRPRDQGLLEMILNRFLPNLYQVTDGQAEVAIVDLDTVGSQEVLATWQKDSPDAPIVVLTLDPANVAEHHLPIAKPISIPSLVELLTGVHKRLVRPTLQPSRLEPQPTEVARPRFAVTPPPVSFTAQLLAAPAGTVPQLPLPDVPAPETSPPSPAPAAEITTEIASEVTAEAMADDEPEGATLAITAREIPAPPAQEATLPAELPMVEPAATMAIRADDPVAPLSAATPSASSVPLTSPAQAPAAAETATASAAEATVAAPPIPEAVSKTVATAATMAIKLPENDAHLDGSQYCGQLEDLPAAECLPSHRCTPEVALARFFDPKIRLLGLLQAALRQARARHQPMQILGLKEPILVVPDDPPRLHCPIKDPILHSLCSTNLVHELELKPASSRMGEEASDSFDALLWKASLWTARGRLPLDLDPRLPVRLTAWPNLSRLAPIPHATRIASLLSQRALSPLDVANMLKIPQRYVFSFVSATSVLGLLESSAENSLFRSSEAPPLTPPSSNSTSSGKQDNRRGLFKRILSSLTPDAP